MALISYGLLVYRQNGAKTEVLLAHPSGPFWASKDLWTIPKGEPDGEDGDELDTAKREFYEETGLNAPEGELVDLGQLKQSTLKINHIWAIKGSPDLSQFASNSFEMEWPPHSKKIKTFKEIDRIEWFDLTNARNKLFPKQREFIDRLQDKI